MQTPCVHCQAEESGSALTHTLTGSGCHLLWHLEFHTLISEEFTFDTVKSLFCLASVSPHRHPKFEAGGIGVAMLGL